MSGRGRGGGGAGTTARNVANMLGMQRHEMNSLTQNSIVEPPPLYPVLNRSVLPLEPSCGLLKAEYISDIKREMLTMFHESPFFLDNQEKRDIKRYTDKYNKVDREKLKPDFSRIPEELCWTKDKASDSKPKRRKIDDGTVIQEKLAKLEEKETESGDDPEEASERSEKSENVDAEALSDDDYAEEDNDYISTYFDNGEGYGDGAGSDDNMDGEEY